MAVTNFIWDELSDNVLLETDENDTVTAKYTNRPEQFGQLISQNRNGVESYYHYDGEHSTRDLTDASQKSTDTYLYTAYGEEVKRTGTTTNPFGYKGAVGYYTNQETTDIYVRNRTYEPAMGCWLSTDPAGFTDGSNLYRAYFVPNNLDPSGLRLRLIGDKVDGLTQLKAMCPEIGLSMDGLGNVSARHCCPLIYTVSEFPVSCQCICDAIDLVNRDITVNIVDMRLFELRNFEPPAASPAFVNGTNGVCAPAVLHLAPKPSPQTVGWDTIVSPTTYSKWRFGTWQSDGTTFKFVPEQWLVLGHELCGHALPQIGTQGQPSWNRPAHDPTIRIENSIAAEHGLEYERGLFEDTPGIGEVGAFLQGTTSWYIPPDCLPQGLTYPN